MPLYDYRCPDCGQFRAWQRMTAAAEPVACPNCQALAGRLMAAPNLALMPAHNRVAHQRNEKSAHEPQLSTRTASPEGASEHHHHGHGHRHHRAPGLEPGLMTSARPWTVGH
jgi:putative FmdB family regulatory protein